MPSQKAKTVKANKEHHCLWCWEIIEKAELYIRVDWANEDCHGTEKYHPECMQAQNDAPREDVEWWYDEECIPKMQRGHTHEIGYTPHDCPACQIAASIKSDQVNI